MSSTPSADKKIYFYILNGNVDFFFNGRVVGPPPLLADMSAKKSSFCFDALPNYTRTSTLDCPSFPDMAFAT